MTNLRSFSLRTGIFLTILSALVLGLIWGFPYVRAQTGAPPLETVTIELPPKGSPMHPPFPILDANGEHVLKSGRPMSTMRTCGQCHDTDFIATHSYHVDMGLSDILHRRTPASGEPWDVSNGPFGRWDPLFYRYLSQPGDERLDLSTAEWIMTQGIYHPGGGPAEISREGQPLTQLEPDPTHPETAILDATTGQAKPWDWRRSGTVEVNCILCHTPNPNNQARIQALKEGAFAWANTATLLGTGIVDKTADGWRWNPNAFGPDGKLKKAFVTIQEPSNKNCAACHGPVHTDPSQPAVVTELNPQTATVGQVFSGQRISKSGMNIQGKEKLTRPWDVHMDRGLSCVDCHFALNNPAQAWEKRENRPHTLVYDPRRLDIGDYLKTPIHDFARGETAQHPLDPKSKGTMRRCEDCHDAKRVHTGVLPYANRHLSVLACETCHIPKLYAPAIEAYDWTVLMPDKSPRVVYRGMDGPAPMPGGDVPPTVANLVTGYTPVTLLRHNRTGMPELTTPNWLYTLIGTTSKGERTTSKSGGDWIAPYNLITTWFWVYTDANGRVRPVRRIDLEKAWFDGDTYAADVVALFDANRDGQLSPDELVLDTKAKRDLIAQRLAALGLKNPHIEGRVRPYSVSHDVAEKGWALEECTACHNTQSRLTRPMQLAPYVPAGVEPTFVKDTNVVKTGRMVKKEDGLYLQPDPKAYGLYIFGHDRIPIIDWFGFLLFVGVILGVSGHAALRIYAAKRRKHAHAGSVEEVYLYTPFERFWHWLQATTIGLLLVTGLLIHRPDFWPALSNYRYLVPIHNVSAALLILDASLSLFYHLTTGAIREFIPKPRGFFDQAIQQVRYYTYGIFRGEPHPFEKVPGRKLNPLQQVTYFGLLNVLLPLQMLTGLLMWGEQYWPDAIQKIGGLHTLAPIHSLVAWLFASFVVGHVYLTTTGLTPLEDIRGMITGWERIEVPEGKGSHEA